VSSASMPNCPRGMGQSRSFSKRVSPFLRAEDIFLLSAAKAAEFAKARQAVSNGANPPLTLRRMRKRDGWTVLRLYSAVTPRNVQHSEAMRTTEGALGKLDDWWENSNGTSYLFERPDGGANSLTGIVRVTRGRLGSWVRLHLQPDALQFADEMVAEMIALVSKTRARPIYVGVRDYEGGIRAALESAGLEWQMERIHMVKHTTVRARVPVPWLALYLKPKRFRQYVPVTRSRSPAILRASTKFNLDLD